MALLTICFACSTFMIVSPVSGASCPLHQAERGQGPETGNRSEEIGASRSERSQAGVTQTFRGAKRASADRRRSGLIAGTRQSQSGEKRRASLEHELVETCGEWSYSHPLRTDGLEQGVRTRMIRLGNRTGNRWDGDVIRKGIHPYGAGRGGPMDLQCPNCKSTDLKKVSLAYQEGLQRVSTRTRLRGVVVGSDGPDVVVGRATTKGTQQTEDLESPYSSEEMVLSKTCWVVGLGVLIGRLDSILCEYDYNKCFVCFFSSNDDLCRAFHWPFRCSFSCLLEAQPLYLSPTVRALGPVFPVQSVWCCEQPRFLRPEIVGQGSSFLAKSLAQFRACWAIGCFLHDATGLA